MKIIYKNHCLVSEDGTLLAKISIHDTNNNKKWTFHISGFWVFDNLNYGKGLGSSLLTHVLITILEGHPNEEVFFTYDNPSRLDLETGQFVFDYDKVFEGNNPYVINTRDEDLKALNTKKDYSISRANTSQFYLTF